MEMQPGRPRFPHRQNEDGSCDSICPLCFATIASVRDETELVAHERAHVCNPYWSGTPSWARNPSPSANGVQRSRSSAET
jgi:hypothetical protein